MKKSAIILAILFLLTLGACSKQSKEVERKDKTNVLKIYSYDSFVSYGLGKQAIPEFERQNNCKVELITAGDAGMMLNRLIMEKTNPQADIAVGIDNTFLQKALSKQVFEPYEAKNLKNIDKALVFDKSHHLTPFDYGYFAFVYDTQVIKNPPTTFGELQSAAYKGKIILIDPRTSSPGKGLFLWSLAAFGKDGFEVFWKSMRNNVLTTPASWDEAYNAFLHEEAPIVLSYATSPAYHFETEKSTRYKAFIPKEGGFRQIEGAGIVNNCNNPNLARKFIEYMLTDDFQKHIPTTQWMYPVLESVKLPEGFKFCPVPEKDLTLKVKPEYYSEEWMNKWLNIMTK
jgi:thiamine transport system substrate-binding protein